MKETKTKMIKQAFSSLGNPSATNRQIAHQCKLDYGFKPSSQAMTAAVGAEGIRKLRRFDAAQMVQVKDTAKRLFDNDYSAFSHCVEACRSYDI